MSKTAKGLVEYAKAQLGLPYWYGTFGNTGSEELWKAKKKQYPQYYNWTGTPYDNFPSQYGKRVHDCVGLIKGYLWSDTPTAKPKYNGSQDTSANGMLAKCKENGSIATIPDIPGVLVFMDGHVGVYIGNGEVIEARGHEYGVVKTQLKSRPWKWWGKCPWIDYSGSADTSQPESVPVKGDTAGKVVKVNCKKLRLKSGTWNVRKLPSADSSVVTTVKGGCDINVADGFVYVPALGGWISENAIEA